jgi:hypothetical protein
LSNITTTKDITSAHDIKESESEKNIIEMTKFQDSHINQADMQQALPKSESNTIPDEIEIIEDRIHSKVEQPRPLGRTKKSKHSENIEINHTTVSEEVVRENTNQNETVGLLDKNKDGASENDKKEDSKRLQRKI